MTYGKFEFTDPIDPEEATIEELEQLKETWVEEAEEQRIKKIASSIAIKLGNQKDNHMYVYEYCCFRLIISPQLSGGDELLSIFYKDKKVYISDYLMVPGEWLLKLQELEQEVQKQKKDRLVKQLNL